MFDEGFEDFGFAEVEREAEGVRAVIGAQIIRGDLHHGIAAGASGEDFEAMGSDIDGAPAAEAKAHGFDNEQAGLGDDAGGVEKLPGESKPSGEQTGDDEIMEFGRFVRGIDPEDKWDCQTEKHPGHTAGAEGGSGEDEAIGGLLDGFEKIVMAIETGFLEQIFEEGILGIGHGCIVA